MAAKKKGFSAAERSAIAAVLDEFRDSLKLHLRTIRNSEEFRGKSFFGEPFFDSSFWEELDVNLLSPETKKEVEKIRERASYEKLVEDCGYILNVTEALRREILKSGTFDSLLNEVRTVAAGIEEEEALIGERHEAEVTLAELRRTIEREEAGNEARRAELAADLNEARREKEESARLLEARRSHAAACRKSRREREELRFRAELEALEGRLDERSLRKELEERLAAETSRFLARRVAAIEEKRAEWEKRREEECRRYEFEIRAVRSEIESRRRILARLDEEHEERQRFIENYLAEKEAARLEEEREKLIFRSAVAVQAWWRGTMVRRKLGPYRPDEKRKRKQAKAKK